MLQILRDNFGQESTGEVLVNVALLQMRKQLWSDAMETIDIVQALTEADYGYFPFSLILCPPVPEIGRWNAAGKWKQRNCMPIVYIIEVAVFKNWGEHRRPFNVSEGV